MKRTGWPFFLLLCLFYVLGTSTLISSRAAAGEDSTEEKLNKEDAEKKRKEKEERDKKEPPLKCSAWCAFKDLSFQPPPPAKPDPNAPPSDQSLPLSTQWEGYGRRGQWATVVVELANLTKDVTFKGTVALNLDAVRENQAGQVPYKTNYRKEFEIGPGGGVDNPNVQRIRFSVLCKEDWNEASEQLILDINAGSQSKTRYVNLKNLDALGAPFIVVVSENEGGFRYLTNKGRRPAEDEDLDSKTKTREVASVRPTDFPTRWHDLTLANLIIIDGPPNEKLSDAQLEALKSYVQAGGNVLITAGEDPSRLKGAWEDLAGITVKGTTNIQSIDEIHPSYQDVGKNWAMTIIDVNVNPDSKRNSLVKRNHRSGCVEMVRRFYGAGSVTFLPFSLNNPALKMWKGRETVPAQIVDHGAVSTLFGQSNAEDIENAKTQPTTNWYGIRQAPQIDRQGLVSLRSTLDTSFSNDTPVQIQKTNTVLSFLLLYLLCAVPGNYFLFGWFRRREVAWLAIPVWAASFSVMAYAVGYMGQTGKLTVNELSVIEIGPHEDVGIARTFFGIYAPQRDDYAVEFPVSRRNGQDFDVQAAPGHLVNIKSQDTRVDLPALTVVDTDNGLLVDRMLIQQRATRRLEIVHRVKMGDGFDITVKPNAADEKGVDIEVENNTGYQLLNPVYVYQDHAIELAPAGEQMLPGTKNNLIGVGTDNGIPWKKKGDAFFGKPVTFLSARGKQSDTRTNALKDFLSERVDHFKNGVVCAWIEEKPLPANIYNSRHTKMDIGKFEGLTLLLVPVGVKHGGQSSTQVLKKGPIPVQYSLNYVQNGNASATWKTASSTFPMQLARYNNGQNDNANSSVVAVQFQSPPNAALLRNDGCYLRLQFRIGLAGVETSVDTDQPIARVLSGNLSVSVETRTDNNSVEWQELTNTLITGLKPDKPFKADAIDIPLGNYKLIQGSLMRLLIRADTTEAPLPLEIRNLDIRVVDE